MAGEPSRSGRGGSGESGRTFVEEARRRQIVEAAIETLAEHGFAGATFARIAARAGISPSLISYHFSSKEQLLSAVVATVERDLDEALTVATQDATTYPAAVRQLIESSVHYYAEHPERITALGEIFRQPSDPASAALADASHHGGVSELESMFIDGQQAGELGRFPTRPMAVYLMACLEAVPGEIYQRDMGPAEVERYATTLADVFVAAVVP